MMLIRIVRMEFEPEKISDFLEIFEHSAPRIRAFEGCQQVQLKRDPQLSTVYYTHSIWHSETHLNEYRNSPFFRETWQKTKQLFSGKPQAYSLIDP